MNDIIELLLTVWDRVIIVNAPKTKGNRRYPLAGDLQLKHGSEGLITTIDGLNAVFPGTLTLVFLKGNTEQLNLDLRVDFVKKKIIWGAEDEEVGEVSDGTNGIVLGVETTWVSEVLLGEAGPGTFNLLVRGVINNAIINSNKEEVVVNNSERLNERIAGAAERGATAIEDVSNRGLNVRLERSAVPPADEQQQLFNLLRERQPLFANRNSVNGKGFFQFMNDVLTGNADYEGRNRPADRRLDFTLSESYEVLKFGAEAYLRSRSPFGIGNINNNRVPLPYYDVIVDKLKDSRAELEDHLNLLNQENINSFLRIPSIELIWSYWMEQGMLVQTMNAISLRFQNVSQHHGNDPLARLDIDPLRPLNNLLWGYIQDEQHSLSLRRRVYEYDHSYGLTLQGRAVPTFKSVDSRSKFLEAFHNLLHSTAIFYRERDDATRFADAFPLLNALREVHMLLAEGNHNSYGNLTWTARIEMMIQQYILARPEMREFLGGRTMVPFQEPWMDRIDSMRQLQNWGSTSITYFSDLARLGELIILSIRLTNWEGIDQANVAAVWADNFRTDIQQYIHSYRTVTGVDLSADAQLTEASFMQPSVLIQRRFQSEQRGSLRNSRIVGIQ